MIGDWCLVRGVVKGPLVAKLGHDVSCPYIGECGEQVGFEERDAVRKAKASGVALSYSECCGGDVGGVDFGGGEFFGQGDGDTAGAGADVDDGEAFARWFGIAAGAEFADGEAVEGYFNKMFGFGAGD